MKAGRILTTPLPVLVDRGRQEFFRALERRVSASAPTEEVRADSVTSINSAVLTEQSTERCLRAAALRFFPGPSDDLAFLFPTGCASRNRVLEEAEQLCLGHFALLGYDDLSFGNPIDWHFDAVSGKRSPRIHWTRIDPLDFAVVGDSKVIWELSRHQWFVRLAQAYRLSGDERYARCFAGNVRNWMRENPPGIGINRASSLEASIRLISWSWAVLMFGNARALTAGLRSDLLSEIGRHAAHISRYLSFSFSPNTHLTGEALGLYYAGTVFAELAGAARWRWRGRKILLRELDRQVYDDGVYFEQSSCYQRYTIEIYLHFLLLARCNADPVPPRYTSRVRSMVDWLVATQSPDGFMPRIGDADGGWLLPMERRDPNDCRGVFALAAAVFRRADYLHAARGETAEVLWMLGHRGREILRGVQPRPPRCSASRCFPEGGYVVMRNDWSRRAHGLLLDTGPLGCRYSAGHGHADLLSLQCTAFGRPVLVDPGTYCYTPDPVWRDYFRATFSHNTLVIDGVGQARTAGPFRWERRPAARLNTWASSPTVDYADAVHDAYWHRPDGVRHRRRVLFVKPEYWVVIDDVEGGGVHEVQLRFQFAPGSCLSLNDRGEANGWMLGAVADDAGLWVRSFAATSLEPESLVGRESPPAGWVATDYGRRVEAPLLVYRTTAELPLRIVSMLVPCIPKRTGSPPAIHVNFSSTGDCYIRTAREIIQINDEMPDIEYLSASHAGRSKPEENGSCVELWGSLHSTPGVE